MMDGGVAPEALSRLAPADWEPPPDIRCEGSIQPTWGFQAGRIAGR
jgi:hypothetical protein